MKKSLYIDAVRCSKILLSGGLLVLLSACASGSDAAKTSAANEAQDTPSTSMDICDTEAVSYAIGEAFDEANVPQLQSESQSRQVRVLRPGDAATMDHRPDRLNVHLNSSDDIEALRCG